MSYGVNPLIISALWKCPPPSRPPVRDKIGSEKDLWSERISKIAKRFLRFVRSSLVFGGEAAELEPEFTLIYVFYAKSKQNLTGINDATTIPTKIAGFITFKKTIAVCLVPILLALAVFSFFNWAVGTVYSPTETDVSFKNINNIFFGEFFTILIISDVILLLLSFFHTDEFHKVIRNSGYIISTILIRISFSVDGLVNTLLIVIAITFGLLILMIHNKFEQNIAVKK